MEHISNKILDRIKDQLGIKTDTELAGRLMVKPNTLSAWRERDTLNFKKIIELCSATKLDMNYIIFEEKNNKFQKKNIDEEKVNVIIGLAFSILSKMKELGYEVDESFIKLQHIEKKL